MNPSLTSYIHLPALGNVTLTAYTPGLSVFVATNVFSASPLRIVTVGCTLSSGVRPCWSTVMFTFHGSPGCTPAGVESSPTVAHPPANALGATTSRSNSGRAVSTRRTMRLLSSNTPYTPPAPERFRT